MGNGAHNFTATAIDAAGNTSATSASMSVTVDTVAPSAPAISSFSNDTGTVGDGVTSDNTLALTGTAAANSTVKVYDGATLLGSATANGSGAWSYTTGTLSNATHSFTATATDAAGNTSAASTALAVTVNAGGVLTPTPTITSFSNDTGTVGDGITNANLITLNGQAPAGTNVQIFDGATQIGTVTAGANWYWSFATATLSNGAHSFTVKATDAAGNISAASTAMAVTVDTVAPAAPAISSFSNDTGTVGDGITSDNTLALTGTAAANSTVKVYDGATLLGSATANGSGAWSYTTAALSNGAHSLTAKATDAAGNVSAASAIKNVTVDTVAPSAPAISSFSNDTGTVGDGVTSDNTLALTGTAAANSTVKVYDGATLLGSATANGSGAWSYTTGTLSNAAHSFTAKATDAAGNTSAASAAMAVTVNAGGVLIPTPTITSFSNDTGTVGDGVTSDNTLALTGTAAANSTVKVYDGATLLGSATANGSGVWNFTTGTLLSTTHSFSAKATDAAGNTSATSAALAVRVNTVELFAPTIASFSNDTGTVGDGITSDNTLTLTGMSPAGTTVQVFDGASQVGTVTADASWHWSFATPMLSNGAHSFTATAMDAAGNTSAASATLDVTVNTQAPAAFKTLSATASATTLIDLDDHVTYVIDNTDHLITDGSKPINGTGNNDTNTLDGGRGSDSMSGRAGYDTHFVDSTGDVIILASDDGTNSVKASMAYTLDTHLENLILTGTGPIDGASNAGANTIKIADKGNSITDFVSGLDKIQIVAADFAGAVEGSVYLVANATPKPVDANACFLFDTDNGKLSWDDDGIGSHAAQLLVTLTDVHSLVASDIMIIA